MITIYIETYFTTLYMADLGTLAEPLGEGAQAERAKARRRERKRLPFVCQNCTASTSCRLVKFFFGCQCGRTVFLIQKLTSLALVTRLLIGKEKLSISPRTHEQLKLCQGKLVKESFPSVRGSRYSLANEKRYSFPAGRGHYLCWELEGEETSA